MSKHALILPALCLLFALSCKKDSSTTPPVTSNVHLKTGLLLYLPFDGNMADSSGNENTTTANGGATLTYDEHGNSASAFGGTGNGENIIVTNNGSIKFDSTYTISMDFMLRTTSKQVLLSMINYTTGYAPGFQLAVTAPATSAFGFAANDSTAGCDNYGYAQLNSLSDTTAFIPQPESWYNAICIYHKGSVQVYINGKLVSSKTGTGTSALLCPGSQVVIGGWWANDPISINGKIDEVRLYNRVLNADEIAELAKNFQDN